MSVRQDTKNVCAVRTCLRTYLNKNISLFRFPKDYERCRQWAAACNRLLRFDSMQSNGKSMYDTYYRICSIHFEEKYFTNRKKNRLYANAVPTQHLTETTQCVVKPTSLPENIDGKSNFIKLKRGKYPSCNLLHNPVSTAPSIEDPLADAVLRESELHEKLNESSKDEEFKESFADTDTNVSSEMLSRKVYKWCFVPQCTNTSISSPNKIFLSVPRNEDRQRKWFNAAQREQPTSKSTFYCCQDHFKLEEDMENYTYHKFMGGAIKLKKEVLPHIFNCQADRKRAASARRSTMPGTYCAISSCKNRHLRTKLGDVPIKYHTFPTNLKLQRQWLQACKRVRTCNPKTHRICSIHFRDEDYERDLKAELLGLPVNKRLKENAVPSLHLKGPPSPSLHPKGPPVQSPLKYKRSRSNSSPSKVVRVACLDYVEQSVEIPSIYCKSEDITIEMHDVKQEVNEPVYQFEQVLLETQNTSHFEFVSTDDVNMDEMVNEENSVVIVPHSDSADILNDIVLDKNSTDIETNSEKQELVIKSNEVYSCTNAECQTVKRNNESLLEKNKVLNSQLKIAEEQLKVKDLKIQQMKKELLHLKSDEYQKDMLDNKIRQMLGGMLNTKQIDMLLKRDR